MLTAIWPSTWSRTQRSNATLVTALLVMIVVVAALGQLLALLPEPIGDHAAEFAEGARTTLYLTLISGAIGLVLGVVAALARTSGNALLRTISGAYIWIIRGTPLLVQILFMYFALPVLVPGLNLPDFAAAVIALAPYPAARLKPRVPWACPGAACFWTWSSPRLSRFPCLRW